MPKINGISELKNIPLTLFIVLGIILLIQGVWVFLDASKRGENKWLWSIFALFNTPSNLLIYLLVTRVVIKSKICPNCNNTISQKAKYCPNCGINQEKLKL